LRIVIKVDPKTRQATEVQFFINGKLDESAPLSCSVSDAQKIGLEVVDRLIEDTLHWKAAEYRHNSDIWKKP
jgi:hypothetical protein